MDGMQRRENGAKRMVGVNSVKPYCYVWMGGIRVRMEWVYSTGMMNGLFGCILRRECCIRTGKLGGS